MPPQKIAFLGNSGAGKTTTGRLVAARLGAVFVELDSLRHRANWAPAPPDEVRAGVDAAIGGRERWVVDGTMQRQLGDFISGRADLLVWLDLPLPLKLWRAVGRSWRRIVRDEPLWNGNRETWSGVFFERDSVVRYAIRSHFRDRRELPRPEHAHKTLRLRTPREVERWLVTL